MDAVKFLQERKRMCRTYGNCGNCPLEDENCGGVLNVDAESLVRAVEEWSAARSHRTRQSVFLEHYPNAKVREGVLAICPQAVEGDSYNNTCHYGYKTCDGCRKTYWHAPIDEKEWRRYE